MTIWATPQLLSGAFGVPVPAVLVTPMQLRARIKASNSKMFNEVRDQYTRNDDIPATVGFTRALTADDWASVEPAFPLTVYLHVQYGLHVALRPGHLPSLIPIGSSNPTWDEAAARAGRVIVVTADVPSYWGAVDEGRFPTFHDTFGDGCWAALAPFRTGPEADLSTWPGADFLGL